MQVILVHDETAGSFDWELPPALADKLSELPARRRSAVRKMIEQHACLFLRLLVTAALIGPQTEAALDIIEHRRSRAVKEMFGFLPKR